MRTAPQRRDARWAVLGTALREIHRAFHYGRQGRTSHGKNRPGNMATLVAYSDALRWRSKVDLTIAHMASVNTWPVSGSMKQVKWSAAPICA